ncbi:hypothetical protein [Devosia rhodophyticola]
MIVTTLAGRWAAAIMPGLAGTVIDDLTLAAFTRSDDLAAGT